MQSCVDCQFCAPSWRTSRIVVIAAVEFALGQGRENNRQASHSTDSPPPPYRLGAAFSEIFSTAPPSRTISLYRGAGGRFLRRAALDVCFYTASGDAGIAPIRSPPSMWCSEFSCVARLVVHEAPEAMKTIKKALGDKVVQDTQRAVGAITLLECILDDLAEQNLRYPVCRLGKSCSQA